VAAEPRAGPAFRWDRREEDAPTEGSGGPGGCFFDVGLVALHAYLPLKIAFRPEVCSLGNGCVADGGCGCASCNLAKAGGSRGSSTVGQLEQGPVGQS